MRLRSRWVGSAMVAVLLASTGCSGKEAGSHEQTEAPRTPERSDEITAFDSGATAQVSVDAATLDQPKPVNGLLAGISEDKPADDLLKPVAPIQVRGWASTVPADRVKALPARWILLLSDAWGYPSENYPNGAGKAPFDDEAGWDTKVGEQIRDKLGRADVLFEPWSAGDQSVYFDGTEAQFLRTWLIAYSAVRRELGPGAYMVGPSYSGYDPDRITRFLEFCLASGCQVDVLSWQEFVGDEANFSTITDHLNDARQRFVENPRYARLGIKEINITEYGSSGDQYRPGSQVAFLRALEQGKADGAGRSCFSAPNKKSNCYNESMDGLLGPSGKPNGSWYVAAAYGQSLGGRLKTETTEDFLAAFASKPTPSLAATQVVIGNHRVVGSKGTTASPVVKVDQLGSIPELASATKIKVQIRTVRPSDSGELGESEFLETTLTPEGGAVMFKVPDIVAHGAAIVTLTPA